MRRILHLLAVAALIAGPAFAQSSPGLYSGQVPTPAQWNSYFAAKQDYNPGVLNGPGAATPGHLVTWGSTYPFTADGGAPPSVAAGTCIGVSGAPVYTVAITPACQTQRGYIDGLILSTAGASQTFAVSVGVAADQTDAVAMSLGSTFSKTNASAWTAGSGNGCMDTGTVANGTWYHIYLIEKTDRSSVDVICSLSASAPALPVGYSYSRRIGSLLTTAGAPNWTAFTQWGDEVRWSTPVNDLNTATLGTTATAYALTVPPGVSVVAKVRGYASSATPGAMALVTSPLVATPVAGTPMGEMTAVAQVASIAAPFTADVLTDTSRQVKAVASAASTTLVIDTYGYVDRRGRNN